MSGRANKKLRQMYNRDVRRTAQSLGKVLGNHLKPKPKWVPWPVWMWGIKIFIKVNK